VRALRREAAALYGEKGNVVAVARVNAPLENNVR